MRRADKLEREVERHVQTLLENPDKLSSRIDATIAAESSRNPDENAAAWLRMVMSVVVGEGVSR